MNILFLLYCHPSPSLDFFPLALNMSVFLLKTIAHLHTNPLFILSPFAATQPFPAECFLELSIFSVSNLCPPFTPQHTEAYFFCLSVNVLSKVTEVSPVTILE